MNVGRGLSSSANITPDGTISVKLDLKHKLPDLPEEHAQEVKEFAVEEDELEWRRFPSLNIVIMIVGSRGDVQPYIALGKRLIADGHRVRLASHETFRSFVNEHGLEFFDIGGDPADLMSYMVKNPGLMPGMTSLTNGDIPRKRVMLKTMIGGCFEACYAADQKTGKPFAADAIISNPPAFAHVHCAEALGVPLLLSFTMPWTPTTAFPHPLVNVKQTNAEPGLTNYLTYPLAELMTWQGIGDIINEFRKKTLGLGSLNARTGPGVADTLKIPWTYCMSSALVPKPHDWRNHIDVTGFYFLDLASNYSPSADLAGFLAAGPVPIYIGFGSVVVDDPVAMTKTIFEATKQAGVRLLLSSGWAKLGQCGDIPLPSHVFILGNVPHDWLFSAGRVAAVVHHGGAGTTAAGLACGLPTLVWILGEMIARAGAGPQPIAPEELTNDNGEGVDRLREAIEVLVSHKAKSAAKSMGESIKSEDGVNKGAESFYKHLPLKNMRCDLDPGRVAVWWSTEQCLKLSAFAAQVLSDAGEINMDTLDLHRPKEYDPRKPVSDP
ncbi:glycosyltransferase family 1 protein [Mucidula mucida]|nr:glycosyltransferase family 1 protein [Mucidula mucida]